MKILAVADEENEVLWNYFKPKMVKDYDLIVSCGDLDREYLDFLVTMAKKPLLFIKGNHDLSYLNNPPGGCFDIEDKVYDYKGVRFLGFGGSLRYKNGECMYTEEEMKKRINKLKPAIRAMGGFDVLVTHAPLRHYGDREDLPHKGFECFEELLNKYRPKYMLYGHVHERYGDFTCIIEHPSGTKLINCCDRQDIEIEPSGYKHTYFSERYQKKIWEKLL